MNKYKINVKCILTSLLIFLSWCPPNQVRAAVLTETYEDSLTADFAERDRLPQTNTPQSDWFKPSWGQWGPLAAKYPKPIIPLDIDPIKWKRARIVSVAKKYIGLEYESKDKQRGHFPARGCGLDCSNFAAWVYNYGLGIQFSSDVDEIANPKSSKTKNAGRALKENEPLQAGDLILIKGREINHVVIYVNEYHVIDSTSGMKVDFRDIRLPENRWYTKNHICIRRPIE